ncbi:substrate-binding domain-containing protein [Clostridium botulinum]|uniref:substrate-binding domain-containing protein n=1 Tax=Clostridium botulinum TaxID=1491 RepID=UPI0027E4C4C8|nr:substrate-binding domain-containing protein [Clostridium botulinum]
MFIINYNFLIYVFSPFTRTGLIKLYYKPTPDAIIAEDDMLAFGSLKVFKEKNLKDISIIGFNNTQLAEFQNPPLASVDINAYELGYYASKILIDSLENNNNVDHYIIDTKLIIRDSIK